MKVYKGVILNKEKYMDTLMSGEKAEQVEESQCGRDTGLGMGHWAELIKGLR